MRAPLVIASLAAMLAGCASLPSLGATSRAPDPAVERGERFAQRACAGCHAVSGNESPRGGVAPAFTKIRLRFTPIALERRLAEISAHGHYEMPPIFISPDEAKDLAAYIQSLGDL